MNFIIFSMNRLKKTYLYMTGKYLMVIYIKVELKKNVVKLCTIGGR